MITRLLLICISSVTLFAQRTPFRVNGSIVNNPTLTNTPTLTWTTSGGAISGTASSVDTIWTNVGTITQNLSNNPVKLINNVPAHGVPLTLDNLDSGSGLATDLNINIQGTNTAKIVSSSGVFVGSPLTDYQLWLENIDDSTGIPGIQILAASRGDIFLGFQSVRSAETTNGFLHIPSSSGLPTGTPILFLSSHTPIMFNRLDNRLWAYNTNWFDVSGQVFTSLSSAAIPSGTILKFGSNSGHVSSCDAASVPLGVALTSTTGSEKSIRVLFLCGSIATVIATNTVTFGSLVESSANGRVATLGGGAGTHWICGRSLETKTNATMQIQTAFFLRDI